MQDLLMGAAVIALGYALYTHFRPASASTPIRVQTASAASTAAGGAAFADGQVSPFTSLFDWFSGTTIDVGAFDGVNYLADMESAPPVYGNGPRVSGGYW